MAFSWRADDGPTLKCWLGSFVIFMELGPVLIIYPIFCDFSGGGDPLSPAISGSVHRTLDHRLNSFVRHTPPMNQTKDQTNIMDPLALKKKIF